MIKIRPIFGTGEIGHIEYQRNNISIQIASKIATTTSSSVQNIGHIIESYRKTLDTQYWESYKSAIFNKIRRTSFDFNNFIPDCHICFYPSDSNRRELLQYFFNTLTEFYPKNTLDLSENFKKCDPNRSITEGLTKDDFVLSLNKDLPPIKNLLIIDDTLNEGRTLNIFLDKLFERGLITQDTKICFAAIYSNPISQERVSE